MNIVTRHNVFETNSSSTHSISINNDSVLFTSIKPDRDGVITLNGGEFGWSWEKFTDPLTKANYFAVDSVGNEDKIKMLVSVIKEHTGAKDVVFDFSDDSCKGNWAYIDHQSTGTSAIAFSDETQLKNFIFNENSILYTGNDNDDEPPNFFDVDLSHLTYKLTLEGTDKPYLLSESQIQDKVKIVEAISNLFSRNEFNKYSQLKDGFFDNKRDEFSMPYKEEYRGVNFDNKTVTLVVVKYHYKKNGDFDKETVAKTKVLNYRIEKK